MLKINLTKTGTLVTPVDFQHLKDVFVITTNKQDAVQGKAEEKKGDEASEEDTAKEAE